MRHLCTLFYHRKNFRSPYLSLWLWQFLALVLLTGCSVQRSPWVHKVDSEEAMKVVLHYAAELEHDQRMYLEDSFITYDDEIYKFHLEFRTQAILDVREARNMLVDTVEGFLDRVNNDPALISQLFEYPLTADNLQIRIFPQAFLGKYVDERLVGLIYLNEGVSCFYAWDSYDNSKDFWHTRSEYYFQSRDTVRYQREGEEIYQMEHKLPESPLKEEEYFPEKKEPPYWKQWTTLKRRVCEGDISE